MLIISSSQEAINFHIKAIINRLVERGERGRTDILFRDTRVLIPAKIINIIVIKLLEFQ